ncbi:MAG: GNAT family N-acetyltransferase [Cyclobacteriaceae bacterium]
MEITFRKADINDLELLQHWDKQPHVIDSDPSDDWHWEEELKRYPAWREQLMAELNGRPIGFVQIIDPAREDSHYWGTIDSGYRALDIWIGEKEDLGKGYGTVMMQMAISRCFECKDVTSILIDPLASNSDAHRFYERLGFRFLEQRVFGDENCFVYELTKADWIRNS